MIHVVILSGVLAEYLAIPNGLEIYKWCEIYCYKIHLEQEMCHMTVCPLQPFIFPQSTNFLPFFIPIIFKFEDKQYTTDAPIQKVGLTLIRLGQPHHAIGGQAKWTGNIQMMSDISKSIISVSSDFLRRVRVLLLFFIFKILFIMHLFILLFIYLFIYLHIIDYYPKGKRLNFVIVKL